MLRGYYTLTSGMLTQERKLGTIGNNMANAATPGFKKDAIPAITFRDQLALRTGGPSNAQLGRLSLISAPDETVINFDQGALEPTDRPLDIALEGRGFFEVQQPDGTVAYTRNGSFTLDNQGYLSLPNGDRVMGTDGPLALLTDRIKVDQQGRITDERTKADLGQLRIVDFNDYGVLTKTGEGLFRNPDQQNIAQETPQVLVEAKHLEQSNVSGMEEMSSMMYSQRNLQSASQILKMYDQIMAKATTELGRV